MKITRRSFLEMTAASSAALGMSNQANSAQSNSIEEAVNAVTKDLDWKPRTGKTPNIVVAILDDVGYADLSCYGSEYNMSFSEDMAKNGTRFNNFHVTAVCAPTRACLFTGRNKANLVTRAGLGKTPPHCQKC